MGTVDPLVRDIAANEPSLAWFGFVIEEATSGSAVVSVTVGTEQVNANGMTHGGLVFAVADQSFAMAATTVLGYSATADAQIHYIAPSRVGQRLVATAKVSWHDERRAIVDVIVAADGESVAVYRGMARAVRRS